MRIVALVLVLAGCGDPLRQDMQMFCRAADVTHSRNPMVIADYVQPRVKTKELRELFDTGHVFEKARALAVKAGLDTCETLDVMEGKAKVAPE